MSRENHKTDKDIPRSEKPTLPDNWADLTPTIPDKAIRPYLERIRKSSATISYTSGLLAMEILNLAGVEISAEKQDMIEKAATNVSKKYIQELLDDQTRYLQQQLADLTHELIQVQNTKHDSVKRVTRLRKAILDYLRDNDAEKLKKIVFESSPVPAR